MLKIFEGYRRFISSEKTSRKRQWFTEHETTPLPYLHEKPSNRNIAFSRFSIVLTVFFWFVYVISVIVRQFIEGPMSYRFTIEAFWYLLVVTFLTFSALMYLLARQGALQRFSKHIRVPRAVIDEYFSLNRPTITVLVPSYSEEVQVIRKTLLSAALQEYPELKIVLLLDDDERRVSKEKMPKFLATREIGKDIGKLLSEPKKRFNEALSSIENENLSGKINISKRLDDVIEHYRWAGSWLNNLADSEPQEDHVDEFFSNQVLRELANDLTMLSSALVGLKKEGVQISPNRLMQLYRRLSWIFNAEVEVFERKKYVSLSHEANKAMNLNAYIGLMGQSYREEQTSEGVVLIPTKRGAKADLNIPDSDFILTLDADSILLREYCLRLVYLLQQPDNSDVAVTQTPYSSFRGSPTRIERLAGATTDVQHILHQGMTFYNATFWVGANAVIRKSALEDIVEKEWVAGFEVKRYVQDRTVIEDTESSIDLALKGWRLVNYPERLSYSATPPDFGSLVVQRRRWANGGLIILPKLFRQVETAKNKGEPVSRAEFLLRVNYMASIAWSNFGLVFLLAYPYDGRLLSPFVLLAALPYFIAMASDLKYCRYSYFDIFSIYGFNLILLPVNIAGVFKSIQQSLTTQKIPFARTPKVKNRTATGLPYVIAPLLIIGFSIFTVIRNVDQQNWGNAAFAAFNAVTAIWAVVAYIGVGNLLADLWVGLTDLLYVDVPSENTKENYDMEQSSNWRAVLYHGEPVDFIPYNFNKEFSVIKKEVK